MHNTHYPRSFRSFIVVAFLGLFTVLPARAEWVMNSFNSQNYTTAGALEGAIQDWINGAQPKDINGVKGYVSWGQNYAVVVFVDKVETGETPIRVQVAQFLKNAQGGDNGFRNALTNAGGKIAILGGYRHGSIFYARLEGAPALK